MSEHITDLTGIGPATASAFKAQGVAECSDLLYYHFNTLESMVPSLASLEEVERWQQVALLGQVKSLDCLTAQNLHSAGITNISELGRLDFDAAMAALSAAADDLQRPKPDASAVAGVLRDATILELTASLTGRVLDEDGDPIAGAEILVNPSSTLTDEEGRFRLTRLSVAAQPNLVIRSGSTKTLIIKKPMFAHANEFVLSVDYAVKRYRSTNRRRPLRVLDEKDGDALPPINAFRMVSQTRDETALSEGDILVIHKFYKRSPDALLVSRFRAFRDGEFLVHGYKVPRVLLPAGSELRSLVQLNDGKLVACDMDDRQFAQELAERRMAKAMFRGVRASDSDGLLAFTFTPSEVAP